MDPSTDRPAWAVSTELNCNDWLYGTAAFGVDVWTHVVQVKVGDQVRFYVNGVFDSTKDLGATVMSNNGPLYIGWDPWYDALEADIDDFAILSRALSDDEVAEHHEATL